MAEEEWPKHECITCAEGMDELVAKGQSWSCECCGLLVGTQDDHEGCGSNKNGFVLCHLCETDQCDSVDCEMMVTSEQKKRSRYDSEEGNAPIQDPMEFGEMANWTPLDGSEGLKRKRAEDDDYEYRCDICDKPAKYNYQDSTLRWEISGTWNHKFSDKPMFSAYTGQSDFYCGDCAKKYVTTRFYRAAESFDAEEFNVEENFTSSYGRSGMPAGMARCGYTGLPIASWMIGSADGVCPLVEPLATTEQIEDWITWLATNYSDWYPRLRGAIIELNDGNFLLTPEDLEVYNADFRRQPQASSGTWSPAPMRSSMISNNSGMSKIGTDTPSAAIPIKGSEPAWVKPVATALGFALGFFGIHEIKKVI